MSVRDFVEITWHGVIKNRVARIALRTINTAVVFLIPRDLRIPKRSLSASFRLCFTGKRGIHGVIGLLSQAWRLFKLSRNGLSEDLFVLIPVNPHEVESHGRAEIERGTIVQIAPRDLACHLYSFLRKLYSHGIGYSLVKPF